MGWSNEIVRVLCGIREPRVMRRFLEEVLTENERHDLALRWDLMKMLHKGVSQRDVSNRLGVSLCKITRGSRVLKRPQSVCRKLLDQSKEGQR